MIRLALPFVLLFASLVVAQTVSAATEWHVPGDFDTIQEAISSPSVVDGDVVVLGLAAYAGDGNRDIDFMGKAITVRSASGDPTQCVILCQASDYNPHRGFIFHRGEDEYSVLEGVTVEHGWVNWEATSDEPLDPHLACGGGLLCIDSAPTITNCIFEGNYAAFSGGAMYFFLTHAPADGPQVLDTIFLENHAGFKGGAVSLYDHDYSTAFGEFDRCVFQENTARGVPCAYGGAATIDGWAALAFRDCLFIENWGQMLGGALSFFPYSNTGTASEIRNCTFYKNEIYTLNRLAGGAGIALHPIREPWCDVSISNSIVSWSKQRVGPGPVHCASAVWVAAGTPTPTFTCSDLYWNEPDRDDNWVGCIEGQADTVNGNFELDPLFCKDQGGYAGDDLYSIRSDSPCAPGQNPPPCDGLIGARPVGCPPQPVEEIESGPHALRLHPGKPNPFFYSTTIAYEIPEPAVIRISIHDVSGRRVRRLYDGWKKPGKYGIEWDAADDRGHPVGAGFYFATLSVDSRQITRRLVRLK